MARRLVRSVHVRDDMGVPHVFGPDDDVPSWAADKISNPAAWSDDASLPSASPDRARESGPRRTETQSAPAAQAAPAADEPPPRSGPGSGTAVWRAYAARHDVRVSADADRGDIIAACEARGVPVE